MEHVSERADADTWTCRIRVSGGGLPRATHLGRELKESGQGATLRGVEVEVRGWLSEEDGALWLRVQQSGERLRLAPLEKKVQWDPKGKSEQRCTPEERTAYERLRRVWRLSPQLIRVKGPLRPSPVLSPDTLEVREFGWR